MCFLKSLASAGALQMLANMPYYYNSASEFSRVNVIARFPAMSSTRRHRLSCCCGFYGHTLLSLLVSNFSEPKQITSILVLIASTSCWPSNLADPTYHDSDLTPFPRGHCVDSDQATLLRVPRPGDQ